ncbi:MAG: zinc ribbon domain-containing protein [Paludibacteraceae bacterium]
MEAMKCTSCGEAVLSTDKFCKHCGKPNEQNEQKTETAVAVENPNKKEEEKFKLYSLRSIVAATFLGGPLVAGILIRRNSLNLGKKQEGLTALIVGIIISTLLILIIVFTEFGNGIPNSVIPLIYAGITYLIVKKMHGQILETHKEEGNEFYSGWKVLGIVLICAVILLGGVFSAWYYFTDEGNDFMTSDPKVELFGGNNAYGKSKTFNGTEVFYTSSITLDEVNRLGKYLIDHEFADGEEKTVQLNKTGNTYEFRMVVKKE